MFIYTGFSYATCRILPRLALGNLADIIIEDRNAINRLRQGALILWGGPQVDLQSRVGTGKANANANNVNAFWHQRAKPRLGATSGFQLFLIHSINLVTLQVDCQPFQDDGDRIRIGEPAAVAAAGFAASKQQRTAAVFVVNDEEPESPPALKAPVPVDSIST